MWVKLRYIFRDVAAYTPAPEQMQMQPATMGMQQPMMVQTGSGYQPVAAQTSTASVTVGLRMVKHFLLLAGPQYMFRRQPAGYRWKILHNITQFIWVPTKSYSL